MSLLGFEIRAPEVATVVRWLLRFILVGFLAWLVKGRQEQEEEEEQAEEDDNETWQRQRQAQPRGGQNQRLPNNKRQANGRDPYAPRDIRQRRPMNSEGVDFDAVINKMSKPKTMWEVRKSGEAPQILKTLSADLDASPKAAAPKESSRPALQLQGRTVKEEEVNALLKKTMLHGHMRPVTWITWNRDGNLLFTCGKDKKVCVWSFPDGECLGSYEGHSGAVWACSVTEDSRWLVTGGADQNVIVWEAGQSRELSRIELPGVCRFVEWASSSGGNDKGERFATVHNKFGSNPPAITVFRFDGETIEQQMRTPGLPGPATQVRWGREDLVLASSHENGELIFWQADTGAEVRRLKAHDTPISKFDFSDDRHLVATASTDKKVKVWDLGEDGTESKLLYEVETDRPLNAVAIGPLTRSMITAGELTAACRIMAGGGQDVRDVAMSSSTSDQFDTLLFKVGADKLEADGSIKGHFGPIHTMAFKSDGSAIATGSEDGCVRLHMFSDPGASK